MNLKKITIYDYYGFEVQFLKYFIDQAQKKGFEIRITSNINEKSEIGIYMQHYQLDSQKTLKINSKLSIFIFHDLMELHSAWPNKWIYDRWDVFHIAILPNKDWKERWKSCSWSKEANPKIGVYELGWPKCDHIFKENKKFKIEREKFLNSLNLKYENTIFYAPSYEIENKQTRMIEALKEMPLNIIIKQAFDNTEVDEFYEEIEKVERECKGKYENVYMLDPKTDIHLCFSISDLIISDESSVMVEGLLFNLPSISFIDWNVGFEGHKRKPIVPFNWIYRVKTENELRNKIHYILNNKLEISTKLSNIKKQFFTNIGTSSEKILDLIESIIEDKNIFNYKVEARKNIYTEEEIEGKFNEFLTNLNEEEQKSAMNIKKELLNVYLYLANNCNDITKHSYVIWGAGMAGNLVYKFIYKLNKVLKLSYYIDKFKTGTLNGVEIKNSSNFNIDMLENKFIIIATQPGKVEILNNLYNLEKDNGYDFLSLV